MRNPVPTSYRDVLVQYVNSYCQRVLSTVIVNGFCQQLLSTSFVNSYCLRVLSTVIVYGFCQQLLSTGFVSSYCRLLLSMEFFVRPRPTALITTPPFTMYTFIHTYSIVLQNNQLLQQSQPVLTVELTSSYSRVNQFLQQS